MRGPGRWRHRKRDGTGDWAGPDAPTGPSAPDHPSVAVRTEGDGASAGGDIVRSAIGHGSSVTNVDIRITPPAPPRAVSGHLLQVRQLAPLDFTGRTGELDAMRVFVTAPEPSAAVWWRWVAPAWAGKTALMACFALRPPPGTDVVAFFITARLAGQNNRAAFCEVVQRQLYMLLSEDEPPVTEHTRDEQFLLALERAAAHCARHERRLVLLVDGLDEDRGVTTDPTAHSIAALLPAVPPHGARIIVAGRPHPPVPDDVPSGHPLRDPGIDRELAVSPAARAVRAEAERDLLFLMEGDRLGRDLAGLVTAAGGGLSAADLARLVTDDTTARLVERRLGGVGGRAFRTAPPIWCGPSLYIMAHDEIHERSARDLFTAAELDAYRARLCDWAHEYQAAGWPGDTPEYLLRGWPELLRKQGDVAVLTDLATDPARHERLRQVSGAHRGALDEIGHAFDLLHTGPDPGDVGLGRALRLAVSRELLEARSTNVPVDVVRTWAGLGRLDRAVALALAHATQTGRAERLAAAATELLRCGRQPPVESLLAPAVECARRAGAESMTDRVRALASVAEALRGAGLDRQAEDIADEAVSLVDGVASGPGRAESAAALARALARAGRPGAARALADEAEVEANRAWATGRARVGAARALAVTGRLEHVEERVTALQDVGERSVVLAALAVHRADTGDRRRAGEHACRAEHLARVSGAWRFADVAFRVMDRASARQGRTDIERFTALVEDSATQSLAVADLAGALTSAGHPELVRLLPDATEPERQARVLATVTHSLLRAGHREEIPLLFRGALLRADIREDIPRLFAAGPGPSGEALTVVRDALDQEAMGDHVARAYMSASDEALAASAEARARIGDGDAGEGLARAVADPGRRSRALAAVAAALLAQGEEGRAEVLAHDAADLAHGITDEFQHAWFHAAVAHALARGGYPARAEALAQANTGTYQKAAALADVAAALAAAGRHGHAERLALEVPETLECSLALADVSMALARAGEPARAAEVARRAAYTAGSLVESPDQGANALAVAVRALALAGCDAEAREIADTIPGPWPRARAMAEVAKSLARAGQSEGALGVVRTVSGDGPTVWAVAAVAEGLAEAGDARAARELARQAAEQVDRCSEEPIIQVRILAVVAATLRRADRETEAHEVVDRAVQISQSIPEQREQGRALLLLAQALGPGERARRLIVDGLGLKAWRSAVEPLSELAPGVLAAQAPWMADAVGGGAVVPAPGGVRRDRLC